MASEQIILRTLSLVIIIINCFIIIVIGIISIKQLKSAHKIGAIFKNLFHFTWIILSIGLLFFITNTAMHIIGAELCMLGAVGLICIYLSAYNILLILIYRLYFSFKDSMFAISKPTKFILISLYTFTVLLFAVSSSVTIIMLNRVGCENMDSNNITIVLSINTIPVPFYILTTIITIIIFAKKLLKLTTFRQNSVMDVNKLPTLKPHQIKMIENATKYVCLLTMGISTSFCTMVFIWICWIYFAKYEHNVAIIFAILSIDGVINTTGLYLQFPFAFNHYEKYCKCLHLCWRYILTKNATNALMNRYKTAQNEEILEMVDTNHQHEDA
eukprot:458613_1